MKRAKETLKVHSVLLSEDGLSPRRLSLLLLLRESKAILLRIQKFPSASTLCWMVKLHLGRNDEEDEVFYCDGFVPVGHVGETVGMRRRCSKLTASCKVQNFSILSRCVLKVSFIQSVFPSIFASDEVGGGEDPVLAAENGAPAEMREDVEFQDPNEIEAQIDETLLTMSSNMKDLQEMCHRLNLPTSGNKTKVLNRLQKYKHNEEVAQGLSAESRREPISIKTPKLPAKHEQEIHALTHIPFAD